MEVASGSPLPGMKVSMLTVALLSDALSVLLQELFMSSLHNLIHVNPSDRIFCIECGQINAATW